MKVNKKLLSHMVFLSIIGKKDMDRLISLDKLEFGDNKATVIIGRINSFQRELDDKGPEVVDDIRNSIQGQISRIENEIRELESEVSNLEDDKMSLEKDLNNIEDVISELKIKHNNLLH